MRTALICENCQESGPTRSWFFACLLCGKEICGGCLDRMATCKECAATKSEDEIAAKYHEAYPEDIYKMPSL